MRRKLPAKVEKEVILNSGRRCSICFGLHRDFTVKKGQIAHTDRNSTNNKVENLVFLCLEHHNEYDSKSKQAKGFSAQEVLNYRNSLYEKVHREIKNEVIYKEELDLETKIHDDVVLIIDRYRSIISASSNVIKDEVVGRFHKICECYNRLSEIKEGLFKKNVSEVELGEQCDIYESQLLTSFGIPNNVLSIDSDIEIDADWIDWVDSKIGLWSQGKCSYDDCTELLWELEEQYNLDYTYILYGIPFQELDRITCIALLSFTYQFGLRGPGSGADVIRSKYISDDSIEF